MGKTATVSFRIPSEIRNGLKDEANKKGLSVNAYVTQSLRIGLEWGPIFDHFDFVHISKQALIALLQRIDEKQLGEVAREATAPLYREIAYVIFHSVDRESLAQVMDILAKYQYSWPTSYSHFQDDLGEHFVIRHGVSRQWSIYLGESLKAYGEALGLQAKYEATSNSTIFTILPSKNRQTQNP